MKSTVSFITPPSPFLLDERVFPSLGILKVAAVVEMSGYPVEHLDLNGVSDYERTLNVYLENTDSRVFAVTSTTPQFPAALRISRVIRDHYPVAKIILGGPHPTLVHAATKASRSLRAFLSLKQMLQGFDVVVAGDGEEAVFQAIEAPRDQYESSGTLIDADDPKSSLFLDSKRLNDLPLPARHLIDVKSYKYDMEGTATTSLIGQLGCPMSCFFCAGRSSAMLRRMRLRDTSSVVNELRHLYSHYGFSGFFFLDDELNINKQFLGLLDAMGELQAELGVAFKCRGFIKAELFTEDQAAAMRRNGFRRVLCGFESGSEKILANIHKNATRDDNTRVMELAAKYGIEVKALMSIGHPGESEKTVQETVDWVREVAPGDFDVTIITPYPGSPYYDRAIGMAGGYVFQDKEGADKLYMRDVDYGVTADYYKGAPGDYKSYVWTDHLTAEDLVVVRDQAEKELRGKLGLEYYKAGVAHSFEASMGQLPGEVFRRGGGQ